MRKSLYIFLFAIAAVLVGAGALGLAGCAFSPGGGGSTTKGAIALHLKSTQAQSITPPISLAVTEYTITGIGPGGATIPETMVTGDTVFPGLVPGSWTISVEGRNELHTAIGSGSGTTTVVIGQQSVLAITVAEYSSPNGTYRLDLSWEPNIVHAPAFTGTLKDASAVVTPQTFTMDVIACTATSSTTDLHPGWYANVVQLFDAPNGMDGSQVLSTGFAEAVRIAAGSETHGIVGLHAVQGYGSIDITITPDFSDPLILTPAPLAFGAVSIYANPTAFSCTADHTATFVWYLRGQQVGVGDSYTLDPAGLDIGEAYRLDVIGFSVDGKHAGSGTWTVTRQAQDITLNVQGTLNADDGLLTVRLSGQDVDNVTLTVPGPGPYAYLFTGVPVGHYKLMYKTASMPDFIYWNHLGTGDTYGSSGDVLTIPNPAGTAWVCNW